MGLICRKIRRTFFLTGSRTTTPRSCRNGGYIFINIFVHIYIYIYTHIILNFTTMCVDWVYYVRYLFCQYKSFGCLSLFQPGKHCLSRIQGFLAAWISSKDQKGIGWRETTNSAKLFAGDGLTIEYIQVYSDVWVCVTGICKHNKHIGPVFQQK